MSVRVCLKLVLSVFVILFIFGCTKVGHSTKIERIDKKNLECGVSYGGDKEDVIKTGTITKDGGVVLAGHTFSFGKMKPSIWALKLDSKGNLAWANTYANRFSGEATAIIQTSDGGGILGGFIYSGEKEQQTTNAYIAKITKNGSVTWEKIFTDFKSSSVMSMAQTSNGDYFISGYVVEDDFSIIKGWIHRMGKEGKKKWERIYVKGEYNAAASVIQQNNDEFVISMETASGIENEGLISFLIKIDSIGTELWNKVLTGGELIHVPTLLNDTDSGFTGIGSFVGEDTDDDRNMLIIRFNQDGSEEWRNFYGGLGMVSGSSISKTSDGGYVATGLSRTDEQTGITKIDSMGNIDWHEAYANGSGKYIAQTKDGGFIIAGDTEYICKTKNYKGKFPDVYVIKINAKGECDLSYGRDKYAPKSKGLEGLIEVTLGTNQTKNIDELIDDLRHNDIRSNKAGYNLMKYGTEAVPKLIKVLKSGDKAMRLNAAAVLKNIGPEAKLAIPHLIKGLNAEDDDYTRSMFSHAILIIGIEKDEIELIIDSLNDPYYSVRQDIVEAIGNVGQDAIEFAPTLYNSLFDKEIELQVRTAIALYKIGYKKNIAMKQLIQIMNSNKHIAKTIAAEFLYSEGIEKDNALEALLEALDPTDTTDSIYAAESLININAEKDKATDFLMKSLESEYFFVRMAAAQALGDIGSEAREAVPSLIEMLKSDTETCRFTAAIALKKIQGI